MTQEEKYALFSLPGMRGNSPGVSSQSQQAEPTIKDEKKAQRVAEDEGRMRTAEERTREATRK
eukprot:7645968-Pyramimonas_sp.AAC.1